MKPGELELAVRLIEDLAQAEFRPQYADEYRVRVRAVVERKRAGGTIKGHRAPDSPADRGPRGHPQEESEARRPLAKAGREGTEDKA